MNIVILSTTLKEEGFLDCMEDFRKASEARGHSCRLVRYGSMGLAVGGDGGERVWGDGAADLLAADLVIPRLSLRRLARGDLYLLDALERQGIAFLNPIDSLEIARSKVTTLQRLEQAGLPVPATAVVRDPDELERAIHLLGPGPYVVKPSMGSKGRDVALARTLREIVGVFTGRWAADRHEILLIQEFIAARPLEIPLSAPVPAMTGDAARDPAATPPGQPAWDIRVLVLRGQIVGAMRRTAPDGEFRTNFALGGRVERVEPDSDVSRLAILAAAAIGLDLAGVDIIAAARGPVVLEVNANPGWEGISRAMAAAGGNFFERFLEILVE